MSRNPPLHTRTFHTRQRPRINRKAGKCAGHVSSSLPHRGSDSTLITLVYGETRISCPAANSSIMPSHIPGRKIINAHFPGAKRDVPGGIISDSITYRVLVISYKTHLPSHLLLHKAPKPRPRKVESQLTSTVIFGSRPVEPPLLIDSPLLLEETYSVQSSEYWPSSTLLFPPHIAPELVQATFPSSIHSPPPLEESYSYPSPSSEDAPYSTSSSPPHTPPEPVQAPLRVSEGIPMLIAPCTTSVVYDPESQLRPRQLHNLRLDLPKVNTLNEQVASHYSPHEYSASSAYARVWIPDSYSLPAAPSCVLLVHPIPRLAHCQSSLLDNPCDATYKIEMRRPPIQPSPRHMQYVHAQPEEH
ncbi:hypothetical protein DFH08DRAFT_825358 [Mycena albidolilacea]|uniref:Uncharacterized protein n=1 Tax=Mycena albidolilacea TaxID=1033008 RepID=A0AAD7EAB8_9AGAR|nr:hypothetical protein DFH08DRAFT_825358 [Mycena albidolilacea]